MAGSISFPLFRQFRNVAGTFSVRLTNGVRFDRNSPEDDVATLDIGLTSFALVRQYRNAAGTFRVRLTNGVRFGRNSPEDDVAALDIS